MSYNTYRAVMLGPLEKISAVFPHGLAHGPRARDGQVPEQQLGDGPAAGYMAVRLDEEGEPERVFYLCPCGCGAPIDLVVAESGSLAEFAKSQGLNWTLAISGDDVPTIDPSVDHKVGCRSHYFIKAGRVEWCGKRG